MEKSVVFIELRIDACAERIGESRVAVALPHLCRTAEKDCRREARKIGKRHREIRVEEVCQAQIVNKMFGMIVYTLRSENLP